MVGLLLSFGLAQFASLGYGASAPQRRQSLPATLPGNWSLFGCYSDSTTRTLAAAATADLVNMTVENCIAFCDAKQFVFAGVEFMESSDCDDFIENEAQTTELSDCDLPCTGNPDESCGGANRVEIFWSGVTPPAPPTMPPFIGEWENLGCFSDNVNGNGRALVNVAAVDGPLTLESCTTACFNAGMPLAGAEFADECYCGTVISNGGSIQQADVCSMTCAGNISEFCGGPNLLTVYHYTGTDLPPPPVGGGGGNGGGGGGPPLGIATDLPEPWAYVGCFIDGANGRVLALEIDNANTTMESCVASCDAQNFTIAGGEFSVVCGNELIEGAAPAPETDCNMACGGNSTQACGAGNRLSIYSTTPNITIIPIPTAQNGSLPGAWVYQGCLEEANNERIFPWEIDFISNNSATTCLTQCSDFGFTAGGMEFVCGDVSDVEKSGFGLLDAAECPIPCSGDPTHLCGGAFSVVVPLIATLGINNKVTFLEKGGTSEFLNSTGAYELDLSLVDNFNLTWREMHVKSDVFCSGSLILPDKAGRQLNVGGWSLDSTEGVRLYTPDGTPGVNGTNDWQENFQTLHLQRQRWYPTAAVLPNGTVLVIGGETGSNGPPQPNLEILPRPVGGDTVVPLDWLNRTNPFNLYPFVHVLPSGDLFVVYYNEARTLDAGTFDTIQTLPNLPAGSSVGRSYPLEGASVLFPLSAPYTDPAEILVCGGSTPGAGVALDNCVSIKPEVENATWALERMVSWLRFPDGTFLIVNGALQGVAGFGLATEPNLDALLYDPSMPFNQRISILNSTIVARLYHSEDSDPETNVNPQEFRIEAQGFEQPSAQVDTMRVSLIAATSSTHGNTMGSRTLFPAFDCDALTSRCTITAPPNAFISPPGWHQLFILDGPTPSHSAWVRIGGDPAAIGNWPNVTGFTVPGI
ncbi:glyoxal oxidase N-terminus-domain-containing protein [Mycena amicta]|nr:glyoxal oxidase N-terminus-domain-containing protein [Mycena amicta]